jgi:hypothetical protein
VNPLSCGLAFAVEQLAKAMVTRIIIFATGFLSLVGAASARPPSNRVAKGPALESARSAAAAPAHDTNLPKTGSVHGRVLTRWGEAISHVTLRVGDEETYSDRAGYFTFEYAPAIYDVTIFERSGRRATAYHGLTRRDPALTHELSTRDLTLDFRTEDSLITLAPETGRIAGTVGLKPAETLTFSYFAPGFYPPPRPPGAIYLGSCTTDRSYDCELPDLTSLRGEYCIAVGGSLSNLRAMRCGGKIGMKDFSIPPQPPVPQITTAEKGGGTMMRWDAGDISSRVFELSFGNELKGPDARVYTSEQSFTWSQLEALGIDFRRDGALLRNVRVTALLPYVSMDDLVSKRGPLAMGTTWQRAESNERSLALPADFKAAAAPRSPTEFAPEDRRVVPACSARDKAHSVPIAKLSPPMANAHVAVRAHLDLDSEICHMKLSSAGYSSCSSPWRLVAAKDSSDSVRIQRAEDAWPLAINGDSRPMRRLLPIEVVATGVLVVEPDFMCKAHRRCYVLDQVKLCAVEPPR